MENNKIVPGVIIAVVALFLIIYLSSSIFITIKSGEAGVLYEKFGDGTVTDRYFGEGFHVIAPWNSVFVYDVRTQEVKEVMEVLSKNGLSIKLELSLRYSPKVDKLGLIHQELGEGYADKVVFPEIRSSARKVIGSFDPEELYSTKRDFIQEAIYKETKDNIERSYINLDAILIRGVELPATIKTAIENKLKQEQESKEYEFRLEKETKEAERKRIEAKGIKDFQDIVSEGISEKLLKWKGIEATLELAKSTNTKVVVIGQGDEGLPIILGGQ